MVCTGGHHGSEPHARLAPREDRVSKFWRLGYIVIVLAVYFVLAPFGYAAFGLLRRFSRHDGLVRARRLQGVLRRAFTLMHDTLRLTRLIDFNPREVRGRLPEGPAVVVANHPCLCDITCTIASFEGLTTAVKPSLYRRFWCRPLLEGARFFEGASQPADTSRVIASGVRRLREGFRVLIFPEGTRSPELGLLRFGRAAFEMACRANVPVVPLVITCTPVWLSKEHGILPVPEQTPRLRVTVLPAVYPADYGFSSRRLRDVVERRVRAQLATPDNLALDLSEGRDGRFARNTPQETDSGILDVGGCEARGHRDGSTAVR